jgi:phosphohistidine phosphatase
MELYLLRHGIAEDAAAGHSDASRALTEEGKTKTEAVVRTAEEAGVKPSLILSSPYRRAVETAQVAASVLKYAGEVTQIRSLVPHGTPVGVWQDLRDYEAEESILLAGHEPLLGQLIAYLLNSPALRVAVKKSCLVRIDLEGMGAVPRGTLRWMLTPRLSRDKSGRDGKS